MTPSPAVDMPQAPPDPALPRGADCTRCNSGSPAVAAHAYCPDPTVIASTNLNLSRLGAPPRDLRTSLLHKQDSFTSIGKFSRDPLAKSLTHQPSKLDLIDDTTLTSLPLPPPLKPKARGSASAASTHLADRDPSVSSLDARQFLSSIPTSQGADAEVDETFESEAFDDDDDDHQDPIVLIEDYMSKSKSPALSNENPSCNNNTASPRIPAAYEHPATPRINTSPNFNDDDELTLINKKRSLATFKQRIFNNNLHLAKSIPELADHELDSISDVSTFTSTFNGDTLNNTSARNSHFNSSTSLFHSKPKNKRTISSDYSQRPVLNYSKSENLEEIFGKIPGSDLLKYCELCEKPLYEISSIINNNKKLKKSKNHLSAEDSTKVNQVYNEFICGECVETYEDFFNELYENELNSTVDTSPPTFKEHWSNQRPEGGSTAGTSAIDSSKNVKLLSIFQSIQEKYDKKNQMANVASKRSFYHKAPAYKRMSKAPFSENLMSRLNYLNSIPEGYTYNGDNPSKNGFGFSFGFKSGENQNTPIQAGASKKSIDLEWIKNLQSKLRWNWGFNGLVRRNSLESDS